GYFQGGRLALTGPTVLEALAGNWVSPARGLWVFSPALVFAVVWTAKTAARKALLPLDVLSAALILGHWGVISSFPHWWGGHSVGPRLFTDVLPCFAWLLAPAVSEASSRLWTRNALALAAALSVFIHGRAAWTYQVHRWNDG